MRKIVEHNRKGFVLVLSLLTASILLALVIPYVSRVVTDYRLTSKIYSSTVAVDLAEVGVELALWEVAHNSFAFNGWTTASVSDGTQYSISVNSFKTLDNETLGDYDATAWISTDGKNVTVTSTGYVPNRTNPDSAKMVKVTYLRNNFGKAIGASGTDGIVLGKNSIIDSYDSGSGTYDETHTNSDGNIATNGPISIPNNTDVWGDANPGAEYPFSSKPDGVHGSWGTLQAPLVYDPIPQATLDAEKALAISSSGVINDGGIPDSYSLDSQKNLVVDKTITLSGSNYYFKSITVNLQAKIIISGESTIYVDGGNVVVNTQGDMNVAGQATFYVDGGDINIDTQGDINNSGVPKNMAIYSTGTSITLITQTDFFGVIYAPNAAISLTSKTAGGEVYGAIACDSFTSGTNTGVHFDKALLNESPDFLPSGVTSWQEIEQ